MMMFVCVLVGLRMEENLSPNWNDFCWIKVYNIWMKSGILLEQGSLLLQIEFRIFHVKLKLLFASNNSWDFNLQVCDGLGQENLGLKVKWT